MGVWLSEADFPRQGIELFHRWQCFDSGLEVQRVYSPIRKVFEHFGMCLGAKVSEYFTNRRVLSLFLASADILLCVSSIKFRDSFKRFAKGGF